MTFAPSDVLCAVLLMALISAAIGWVFGEVLRRRSAEGNP